MNKWQWHPSVGWRTPQLLIQITPLSWGIGGAGHKTKLAFQLGPIAFALHWGMAPFEAQSK